MYKCRKYKLQRIAVTIAAILWIVTAVRSFMERSIYAVNIQAVILLVYSAKMWITMSNLT